MATRRASRARPHPAWQHAGYAHNRPEFAASTERRSLRSGHGSLSSRRLASPDGDKLRVPEPCFAANVPVVPCADDDAQPDGVRHRPEELRHASPRHHRHASPQATGGRFGTNPATLSPQPQTGKFLGSKVASRITGVKSLKMRLLKPCVLREKAGSRSGPGARRMNVSFALVQFARKFRFIPVTGP